MDVAPQEFDTLEEDPLLVETPLVAQGLSV